MLGLAIDLGIVRGIYFVRRKVKNQGWEVFKW